jgi:hypothetical protein
MKLHREYFRREYQANLSAGVKKSHHLAGQYLNEFLQFPKVLRTRGTEFLQNWAQRFYFGPYANGSLDIGVGGRYYF